MTLDLEKKIALITGAGAGLGRSHALALAARGARVVVNDLDADAARAVCEDIRETGGEALEVSANVASQDQVEDMVECVRKSWGDVSILVNNAGILRDRSFAKMDVSDFRLILDVHLMGAVHCAKAVWNDMRDRQYGRIVFTTSSSGLYGNFGQANYGAAKMALVGLMQTLALEGERYNIRVNCLAPSAATAMTNGLYSDAALRGLGPELVSPGLVALVGPDAPTRRILLAGAGAFEQANITMTRGLFLGGGPDVADDLIGRFEDIADREGEIVPANGGVQYQYEVERALSHALQTAG